MNRDRAEDPLREMRSAIAPVDSPEAVRARRERTVAHLRGLQARSTVLRQFRSTWRKRLLVAAAVLIPSLAAGASVIRWSELTLGKPDVPAATPANVAPGAAHRARALAGSSSLTVEPSAAVTAAPLESSNPAHGASTDVPKTEQAAKAAVPYRSPTAVATDSSSLAAENRLMLAAMAAKRAGDEARSVQLFTDLLARHPASPLAQNAMIERFRSLKRSGNKEAAAQAALRYLHDYPAGMASDEARGVAAEANPEAPKNAFPP